jgi:hypothetical protein
MEVAVAIEFNRRDFLRPHYKTGPSTPNHHHNITSLDLDTIS